MHRIRKQLLGKVTVFTVKNIIIGMQEARNASGTCAATETKQRSSTNTNTVAVAKITGEREWRVGKKCLCVAFWLT